MVFGMVVVAPKFLNFIRWVFNIKMGIGGLAVFPFIIVPREECKEDTRLINHEKIHIRQQVELLFVGFVILYFFELYKKGYMGISFEKEAYKNQHNLEYLKTRKWFSFYKYIN